MYSALGIPTGGVFYIRVVVFSSINSTYHERVRPTTRKKRGYAGWCAAPGAGESKIFFLIVGVVVVVVAAIRLVYSPLHCVSRGCKHGPFLRAPCRENRWTCLPLSLSSFFVFPPLGNLFLDRLLLSPSSSKRDENGTDKGKDPCLDPGCAR